MKAFVLCLLSLVLCMPTLAADPPQTRVSVTSQPAGATVIVDGRDRGVTPLMLFDLTPGRHHLKFRLAGYCERDRFVDTTEGPFVEKNEVLVEEKGLLLLKTDPPDCDILIDNVSVGRSPRLVTNLAAKDTYRVKFRKPGYLDQTVSVRFEGRKPRVCEAKLVLASGTIDVMSEPAGAEVTVNGIVRGTAPVKVTGVPKGRAVVKFHLDGFEDETRELSVNAGDAQTLPVVLKAMPGTLHLVSVPDGARFYVDDEVQGKSPLTIPGMKPGEYKVRAELEGYGVLTRTIALGNGESAREEFRLSNVMGRLEVRTSPAGAQLILDGKPVGVTKSSEPDAAVSDVFPIESLLEGEHTLVVRKDGYREEVRHPKIQNSKTSKHHNIRLIRIFVPDVEIVTARGTYQGVFVSKSPELVTIEVKLGITQSFARDEIRSINFLKAKK